VRKALGEGVKYTVAEVEGGFVWEQIAADPDVEAKAEAELRELCEAALDKPDSGVPAGEATDAASKPDNAADGPL
jgi:hypothetical protein